MNRLPILRKRIKSRKRRFLVFGILAVVVLILIAGKILGSPAEGTINSVLGSRTESSPGAQKPPERYDGKYISFNYPSGYQSADTALSGNFLEVYRLYGAGHSSSSIAIGLIRETVDNDPGFHFRQDHPKIYQLQASSPGSQVFVSRQNGFERTVYISHNGLVLSLSAVDPSGRDLTAAQDSIITSLKWK